MIAVDTNLLIYAHREDSDFHPQAVDLLKALSEGDKRWSIPWPCLHEFLAIATHPRIYDPPSPLSIALDAMDTWIRSPGCELIGEDTDYFRVLKELTTEGKIVGPKIHDARIAAICIHHDVEELLTADRDFSRFIKLKTRNSLTNP